LKTTKFLLHRISWFDVPIRRGLLTLGSQCTKNRSIPTNPLVMSSKSESNLAKIFGKKKRR